MDRIYNGNNGNIDMEMDGSGVNNGSKANFILMKIVEISMEIDENVFRNMDIMEISKEIMKIV